MKRLLTSFLLVAGIAFPLWMTSVVPARADATNPQENYPTVSHLTSFTLEANYMSLPGYLRFLVYTRDGIWLTHEECAAIVDEQIATGGE